MRAVHLRRLWIVGFAVVGAAEGRAHAWGDKGHTITAHAAAVKLPKEMPAFFRKADIELAYLCPDPDRWRDGQREAALKGAMDRDHIFKLEDAPDPMPPQRYDFFTAMTKKPRHGGGLFEYKDLGFAPYAIAERAEMLTVHFILWRIAPQRSPEDKRIKRQLEQNIIHVAGELGHFVTDTGMPLHTSIHSNGWRGDVAPNPHGYVGKDLHGRFERDYIEQAIDEKDFVGMVQTAPRQRGPWLDAAMEHIRASHQQVERMYELDKESAFGEGAETAAQKIFTCERLAFSAAALRDFWYTAWVRSGELAPDAARRAAEKVVATQKIRDKARLAAKSPHPSP